MEQKIQAYNKGYNDEENQIIEGFIQNASVKDLVDAIEYLVDLHDNLEDKEKVHICIKNNFMDLIEEVRERQKLKEQYSSVLACEMEWKKCRLEMEQYKDSLYVREKYRRFKNNHTASGTGCIGETLIDYFLDEYADDKIIKIKYCKEMIRRFTFSEDSKNGIQKPELPKFFESINEIPYSELNNEECLETLGIENLKYLLTMLLYRLDVTQNDAKEILSFLRVMYSRQNKKKDMPLFSVADYTKERLIEVIEEKIEVIKRYKAETLIIQSEIK